MSIFALPLYGERAYHQGMKKNYMPQYLIFGLVVSLGSFVAGPIVAQTKVIKEVPAHMTRTLDGQELYREYCAVCHGVDAKGSGPAADALKKSPSDLTQLSRKNGGKFPTLAVQMNIKGSNGTVEHGTREMPMWGSIFSGLGQYRDTGELRVMSLLKYIEQIQAK